MAEQESGIGMIKRGVASCRTSVENSVAAVGDVNSEREATVQSMESLAEDLGKIIEKMVAIGAEDDGALKTYGGVTVQLEHAGTAIGGALMGSNSSEAQSIAPRLEALNQDADKMPAMFLENKTALDGFVGQVRHIIGGVYAERDRLGSYEELLRSTYPEHAAEVTQACDTYLNQIG